MCGDTSINVKRKRGKYQLFGFIKVVVLVIDADLSNGIIYLAIDIFKLEYSFTEVNYAFGRHDRNGRRQKSYLSSF